MRLHAQLRVRHRSPKMHRLSRVHDRLQGRARHSGRRESLLGQDGRERHVPRHAPLLLPGPLQPVRRRAVREDLPDQRALQAPRRHRRSATATAASAAAPAWWRARTISCSSIRTRTPPRSATSARTASRTSCCRRASASARPSAASSATSTIRRAKSRRSCSAKRSRCASPRRARARRSSTSAPTTARSGRKSRRGRSCSRKARCICARSARPKPDPRRPGAPRVDYDMPHEKPWGFDMVLYLLTKGDRRPARCCVGALLLAARRSHAAR